MYLMFSKYLAIATAIPYEIDPFANVSQSSGYVYPYFANVSQGLNMKIV